MNQSSGGEAEDAPSSGGEGRYWQGTYIHLAPTPDLLRAVCWFSGLFIGPVLYYDVQKYYLRLYNSR